MTIRDFLAIRVLYFPASAGLLGWAMTLRHVLAPLILCLAALALSGCSRSETFRYRLTVEVETPKGLRSGSSVLEVDVSETGENSITFPEARGISTDVRGEAVAVDLPHGKVLFALLRSQESADAAAGWPIDALKPLRPRGDYDYVRMVRAMKDMGELAVLPRMLPLAGQRQERSGYPMLVTFRDIDDPTSVELVDPDDLAATFGEGVSLKRITVQITDDPVTTGIEKRLGWLTGPRRLKMKAEDYPTIPLGNFHGLFSSEYNR